MSLTAGDEFAGYTIIRRLGAGGMGEVYLAQHPRLPRTDAIKVLPASLTTDPDFRARFVREADLVAGLWHPHIVGVHDRGEFEGKLWIAMDYVEGTDAQRLLEDQHPQGVPVVDVVEMVAAVADALDYAHQRGLLHRDVKPGNILLSETGNKRRISLADFGIARQMDEVSGLTATNMAIGSMAYAAPEQLSGGEMDGRADQYALACTAFHLLTGSAPFAFSNPAVMIGKHLTEPAPPISERRPEFASADPVFATALAKDPQARFPSCTAFASALARETGVSSSQAMTAHAVPNQPPGWSPMPGQPPLAPAASPSSKNTKWLIPAAVGAVLVVVIGIVAAIALSGESDQPSAAETSTATAMPSASGAKPPEQTAIPPAGGAAAPGQPVVLIDGQNQDVTGDVTCVTYQGETYLTIQGAANISVGMRVGSPPVVTLIGMDRVGGLSLGYTEGGEGSVQATKDGSTYTVSGTITGADSDNPTGKLTKSVEITVVCP
jgi:serine/threonine-protein kinase